MPSRINAQAEGQELTLTRMFYAPRNEIWEAWTKPEIFSQWFGAPGHSPIESIEMDVREGGEFRATISAPGGEESTFVGNYLEVKEPEMLVLALDNVSDRTDPHKEIVSMELTQIDGQTKAVFKQKGHLPPKEYATGLMEGWSGFIVRLAEIIEAK